MSLDIRTFTRTRPSGIPFMKLVDSVLPGWDISLVFSGERRARQLNSAMRGKDYVPNVLSYVSGEKSGEIIICPSVAARQAASYGMDTKTFVAYLFIHGLLHLKGLPHGATMERQERTTLARFGFSTSLPNGTTHRNRH